MKSASFGRGFWFGDGAKGPGPGERRRRRRSLRRQRLRSRALEVLEPRTLLAVLPPPSIATNSLTGQPFRLDISNPTETVTALRTNESNPSIAVSPNDPNKMVMVWQEGAQIPTNATPIAVRAAFSLNGGQSWTQLGLPQPVFDPNLPGSNTRLTRVTEPSVSFDRNNNLYILAAQGSTQNRSGAIVLQKYSFSGNTPTQTIQDKIIYAWNGDAAVHPTLAVDNTLPSYTDPNTLQTLTNPFVGYVYIAWATDDLVGANPNTIKMVASADGGQTFTTRRTINDEQNANGTFFQPTAPGVFPASVSGNTGPQRNTQPRLVISQGTLDGRVPPGQVTVMWDDFGTGPAIGRLVDLVRADRVSGTVAEQSFTTAGTIGSPNPNLNETERITNFPITVNINAAGFITVNDINVRLAIENLSGASLDVTLVAPDGRTLPLVPAGANQFLGIGAGGQIFGTVFDQEATTPITAGTQPFIGNFLPAFQPPAAVQNFNLSDYYNLAKAGVGGTWYVRVRNTSPLADINRPPILRMGQIEFSSGLRPGVDTVVTTSLVRGTLAVDAPRSGDKVPFPLTAALAPVQFDRGIGPGATIVSSNTVSAGLDYTGRMYVAYVDFVRNGDTSLALQTDNTDIFLRYSDDGGLTWSVPRMVNDDINSNIDGYTESLVNNQLSFGRPQFMPSLAIDPSTGTLAVSFYDARWDAGRTRAGMTVTTSIDGGNTFSPQGTSYANKPNNPFDEITRNPVGVDLGPIPDNLSAGNPATITFTREAAPGFGFGDRQALLFLDGKIYVGWSGNENGGNQGLNLLDVRLARLDTAAGPRVISSTMGPVQATTTDGVTFNAAITSSGTPQVEGFQVKFDRPVDTRTFTTTDVAAYFRSPTFAPTPANPFGEAIAIASVTPLDRSGPFVSVGGVPTQVRATSFLVRFSGTPAELSRVGTYSYAVGPNILDFGGNSVTAILPNPTPITGTTTDTPLYTTLELPQPIAANSTKEFSLTVSGLRADEILTNLDATLAITAPNTSALQLYLVGPDGTTVALAKNKGTGANYGMVVGGTVVGTTRFSDAAVTPIAFGTNPFIGDFVPEESLSAMTGNPVNGTYKLRIVNTSSSAATLNFFTLNLRHGPTVGGAPITSADAGRSVASVDVAGFNTTETVKSLTVHTQITHSRPSDLTLFLIAPDGTRVPLANSPTNVITTPLAGKAINGVYRLEVNDTVRGVAGTINRFWVDVTAQSQAALPTTTIPSTGVANARTAVLAGFSPGQEISDITVNLSIAHARPSDLVLTLIAPDGTQVLLSQRRGGNTPNAFNNTTFSDSGATSITNATAPFTNLTLKPELPTPIGPAPVGNAMSKFFGKTINGQWTLQIQDTVSGGNGNNSRLISGSIHFETQATVGGDAALAVPNATAFAGRAVSTLAVAPAGTVQGVDVTVSLNHPSVQDLSLYLVAPNGTRVTLVDPNGGAPNAVSGANFINTRFIDGAALLSTGSAPYTGNFAPATPLSALVNATTPTPANGVWQLEVVDHNGNPATGALVSWSLNLTTNVPYPSVDVPQAIPDDNGVTSIDSSLGLFNLPPGTVIPNIAGAVEVTLNITHPTVQELDVTLIAPDGTSLPLVLNGGTPSGANFTNTTISNAAGAIAFAAGASPYNSSLTPFPKFLPEGGSLNVFNGKDPKGIWTLRVRDVTNATVANVGTLTGWSLNLLTTSRYGQAPNAVVPAGAIGNATTTVVDFPAATPLNQLDVTVSVAHAGSGDLSLFLIGPDNTRIFLGKGTSFNQTTFTDLVQTALDDGSAPYTGLFLPEEPLNDNFGGKQDAEVNGVWRLEVANPTGTAATITQFQLSLRQSEIQSLLPGPIPDEGVTTSTIAVTGVPAGEVISEVNVVVSVTHPRISDIQLTLIAPDGTRVLLSNGTDRNGAAFQGADYDNTIFMDNATLPINFPPPGGLTTLAPYTGRFRPVEPLQTLLGKDPNGLWRLEVKDTVSGEEGTLDRFQLRIRTVPAFVSADPTLPKTIPNPGTVTSTQTVSGFLATDRIADLNVNVKLTHPEVNNLRLALVGPDGTRVQLVTNVAPTIPPNGADMDLAFDDQAIDANFQPRLIAGAAAPHTGRYRPVQLLSAFNSRIPNGTWTLEVTDSTGANAGTAFIESWSLEIQTVDRANQMPKPVNDLSFTTAEIVVSGAAANQFVQSVSTHVSITHPVAQDLEIYLIGPNGFQVALARQRGGNAANAYIDTTFSDTATASITTANAPFTGAFRPEQPLAGFNGVSPNGVWQLLVYDRATGQLLPTEGLLNNFSITIGTASTVTTITSPNPMDQDADAQKAEAAPPGGYSVDAYAAPRSFAGNPFANTLEKAYNGSPFQAPYDTLTLPLMISGPHLADTVTYPAKPAQVGQTIPNLGAVNSTITIGGDVGRQITSATVTVNISHTRVSDLVLTLIAPDGTQILLAQNQGAGGANYNNAVFDDTAINLDGSIRSITGAQAPFVGRYRPQSYVTPLDPALGKLVGKAAAGTWTLRVQDTVAGVAGVLNGWSLTLGTTLVATDRPVSGFNIVFDRDMDPTTITAADIIRVDGPTGTLAAVDPIGGGPAYTIAANPNADTNYPDPDLAHPRTYRISFATPQVLGGSYTVVLGSDIRSKTGELMDNNRNAGLDALRGIVSDPQSGTLVTLRVDAKTGSGSTQLGLTIPANGSLVAPLVITDNFLIQDVNLQLNIAHTNVPNLEARLVGLDPTGDPTKNITVLLFKGVGNTGTRTNFQDTVFDDSADTPIQNGGPPFLFSYNPQVGLPIVGLPGVSGVPLSAFNNQTAARTWQLEITNTGSTPGTLNSWSLTFKKPIPGTGLGEPVADRSTTGFRIFTMDPTKPLSSNTWSQVSAGTGARGANLNAEVAGRVNAIALDPSDPSGNTAYIATPAGGIWKTTNFLTKDPTGPSWIALTPDAPTNGLHIGSITIVGRNNDPNQSIILAGTGDAEVLGDPQRPDDLTSRGIGFLRSTDGGKTWELLDSRDNSIPFSTRDHFFAAGNGTVAYRIVADPKLTPTGDAIFYAALSDLDAQRGDTYNQLITASGQPIRGGLWRSVDSGKTWTQMRAGQATDVVLDLNSGTGAPGGNLQRLYAAFRNDGVYESPNRGQLWNPMPGIVGNPLVQNGDGTGQPVPVPVIGPPPNQGFQQGQQFANSGAASTRLTPNSYTTDAAGIASIVPAGEPSLGRILLAKPQPTGDALKDALYQGWLYAAVMVHNELNVAGLPPGDQVQYPNRPTDPPSNLWGIFVTKDYGASWTRILNPDVGVPTNWYEPTPPVVTTTPINDPTGVGSPRGNYYFKANFSSALAVDPNDPNVIYFGSTDMFGSSGMIRISTTGIADSHALYLSNDDPNINPTIGVFRTYAGYVGPSAPTTTALNQLNATGAPLTLTYNAARLPVYPQRDPALVVPGVYDPKTSAFVNLLRDPAQPFVVNATILVAGVAHVNNPGTKNKWIPWTFATQPDPFDTTAAYTPDPARPNDLVANTWNRPTRGVHQILTVRDPLTGASRVIMVNDDGVYTAVDEGDGSLVGSVGSVVDRSVKSGNLDIVNGSRNGNLGISELLSGASQPSTISAQTATLRGMFYGNGTDTGQLASDPNIINVGQSGYGNISWTGTEFKYVLYSDGQGNRAAQTREAGYGVGVGQNIDPITGRIVDYVYYFANPEGLVERDFVGDRFHPATDFFQGNGISLTNGLVQANGGGDVPDGQWPFRTGYPFAINPRDGGQVLISSGVGRIFLRDVSAFGDQWALIGNPASAGFDGTLAQALAFGAPKPTQPGDPPPTFSDHLYAGTVGGHAYVTFTGGGTPGVGNQWKDITANLAALQGGALAPIVSIFPNPDAGSHELYMATERGVFYMADSSVAAPQWVNITGNLFNITFDPFDDPSLRQARLQALTSLQVDWRYVIPDNFGNPAGPAHPLLYVAGDGGVYRSIDKGGNWHLFPDVALNNSPLGAGGGLPNSRVSDLDLSLGPINQTTGRPDTSKGPNILLASTYGTGQYAIRLAPLTIPNQPGQPNLLGIDAASDSGLSSSDGVTNIRTPNVIGLSEQTAFGNVVYITLYDLSADPANPRYIGGFPVGGDPNDPANLANLSFQTDTAGHFGVQVLPGMLTTDGVKTIGVQATSLSGTKGNMATFQFTLDTTPPAAPTSLQLQAISDTGLRNDDQITMTNANLNFRVAFTADPNGLATQVQLHRNNLPVGAIVQGINSATVIDGPAVVTPDGTYGYRVRLTDLAGNQSDLTASPLLNVRIDTRAPAAPSKPVLDPNNPAGGSDSGIVGDNITNVRQPYLSGTAEANQLPNPNDATVTQANRIQILDAAGNVVGTGSVTLDGKYLVRPDAPLADGSYTFVMRVTDVAGNQSPNSQAINITINSVTPTKPTLRLVLADDSGIVGDNITNKRQPRLEGAGDPDLNVQIISYPSAADATNKTNGTVVAPLSTAAPIIVQADRTYSLQYPTPLADGTYYLVARTFDPASGNFNDSATLKLVILTQGPTQKPTLALYDTPGDSDDTGIKGDGVTSIRKPRFRVTGVPAFSTVQLVRSDGTVLETAQAGSTGELLIRPPLELVNGAITLYARLLDDAGNVGPPSDAVALRIVATPGDYNVDGLADLAVYRPGTGAFLSLVSNGGAAAPAPSGGSFVNIPIEGDFDGDGRVDLGYFNRATATWVIQRSQLGLLTVQLGTGTNASGQPVPIVGDFDGDGIADRAVFDRNTGAWLISQSRDGEITRFFGQPGDTPLAADFDGDFKTDLAVYTPSTGAWAGQLSAGGTFSQSLGQPGDFPVPADYTGDGRADLVVYRPSTGEFLTRPTSGGTVTRLAQLSPAGAIPVPRDYDNDGKTDPAIFVPSTGQWIIAQSSLGGLLRTLVLGTVGDKPLAAPFDLRTPTAPTIGLLPADDTGTTGDGVTTVHRPNMTGTGTTSLFIRLIDVDGKITGTAGGVITSSPATVAANGSYQIQFPANLADGTYKVSARLSDAAGNFIDSGAFTLQITTDTGPGPGPGPGELPAPSIVFLSADDTGPKGDGRTSVRQPRFSITSTANTPVTVQLLNDAGTVLASQSLATAGTVTLRPSSGFYNSTVGFRARVVDSSNNSNSSDLVTLHFVTTPGDFDADGIADFATYRRANGAFSTLTSTGASVPVPGGGTSRDVPIQLDYDGDGRVDLGYFRPSTATWVIQTAQGQTITRQFGPRGNNVPIVGDFDGDGRDDIGVYVRSTSTFSLSQSSAGNVARRVGPGNAKNIPVVADFDGDGRADLAVFTPNKAASWTIALTGGGIVTRQFGNGKTDVPAVADFDGDGKADMALFRAKTGQYLVKQSSNGAGLVINVGGAGSNQQPVPQDFDADGKADATIFRPTTAQWVVRQTSNGQSRTVKLGSTSDVAVGTPYQPWRVPPTTSRRGGGGAGARAAASSASIVIPNADLAGNLLVGKKKRKK